MATAGILLSVGPQLQPLARAQIAPIVNGRIVFSRAMHQRVDLYSVQPDGGGLRNLTHDLHPDFDPTWSPDGQLIAFTTLRIPASHLDQIWTMDPRGGHQTQITDLPRGGAARPAWSPMGGRIVFEVTHGPRDTELFTVGADGTNPHQLTDNTADEGDPAWSPDGRWIAFDGNGGIAVMRPNGAHVHFITPAGSFSFEPAWSPTGDRIVFTRRTRAGQYDLFSIHPDASGLERLTDTSRDEATPDWSPDGRRIVYIRTRVNYESDIEVNTILTMRADGTHRRKLSSNPAFIDRSPDWRGVA